MLLATLSDGIYLRKRCFQDSSPGRGGKCTSQILLASFEVAISLQKQG